MSYTLQRSQVVGGSVPELFAFFKDPANLGVITPPWLRFALVHSTHSSVTKGTQIQYRIGLHGIPMRWESRITEFVDNVMFADEMLKGPYRSWYHEHRFRPVEGGTEIEDVVTYTLPFGILGKLAHTLWVKRQLDAIFRYRQGQMDRLFPETITPVEGAS